MKQQSLFDQKLKNASNATALCQYNVHSMLGNRSFLAATEKSDQGGGDRYGSGPEPYGKG